MGLEYILNASHHLHIRGYGLRVYNFYFSVEVRGLEFTVEAVDEGSLFGECCCEFQNGVFRLHNAIATDVFARLCLESVEVNYVLVESYATKKHFKHSRHSMFCLSESRNRYMRIHISPDSVLLAGQSERAVLHAESEVHIFAVPRLELGFVFHVYIELALVERESQSCDVADFAQCVVSETRWIRELFGGHCFLLYGLELLALELLYNRVQVNC